MHEIFKFNKDMLGFHDDCINESNIIEYIDRLHDKMKRYLLFVYFIFMDFLKRVRVFSR